MVQVIYAVPSHDCSKSLNGREDAAVPIEVSDGHEGDVAPTDEEDPGKLTLHVIVTRY